METFWWQDTHNKDYVTEPQIGGGFFQFEEKSKFQTILVFNARVLKLIYFLKNKVTLNLEIPNMGFFIKIFKLIDKCG